MCARSASSQSRAPTAAGPITCCTRSTRAAPNCRVVADVALGDVVSVQPVVRPRYFAGPRIIHVLPPKERSKRNGDDGKPVIVR
jgi:hypothetical protein